ncbi:MAG: hypothetical protein ABIQ18_26495, partial [Umezawaea sp.]
VRRDTLTRTGPGCPAQPTGTRARPRSAHPPVDTGHEERHWARIRTGSSTSCTAPGSIEPSNRLDYYCFTEANDGYTWTYLRDVTTGKRGWTRDDLLPNNGSYYHCPN